MPVLLVVHHSPTPSVETLTEAVLAGTRDEAISGVDVLVRPALEATVDDVLGADGYLIGTTANFGYMSGALKHFFDSLFLQVGGSLAAPALVVVMCVMMCVCDVCAQCIAVHERTGALHHYHQVHL